MITAEEASSMAAAAIENLSNELAAWEIEYKDFLLRIEEKILTSATRGKSAITFTWLEPTLPNGTTFKMWENDNENKLKLFFKRCGYKIHLKYASIYEMTIKWGNNE